MDPSPPLPQQPSSNAPNPAPLDKIVAPSHGEQRSRRANELEEIRKSQLTTSFREKATISSTNNINGSPDNNNGGMNRGSGSGGGGSGVGGVGLSMEEWRRQQKALLEENKKRKNQAEQLLRSYSYRGDLITTSEIEEIDEEKLSHVDRFRLQQKALHEKPKQQMQEAKKNLHSYRVANTEVIRKMTPAYEQKKKRMSFTSKELAVVPDKVATSVKLKSPPESRPKDTHIVPDGQKDDFDVHDGHYSKNDVTNGHHTDNCELPSNNPVKLEEVQDVALVGKENIGNAPASLDEANNTFLQVDLANRNQTKAISTIPETEYEKEGVITASRKKDHALEDKDHIENVPVSFEKHIPVEENIISSEVKETNNDFPLSVLEKSSSFEMGVADTTQEIGDEAGLENTSNTTQEIGDEHESMGKISNTTQEIGDEEGAEKTFNTTEENGDEKRTMERTPSTTQEIGDIVDGMETAPNMTEENDDKEGIMERTPNTTEENDDKEGITEGIPNTTEENDDNVEGKEKIPNTAQKIGDEVKEGMEKAFNTTQEIVDEVKEGMEMTPNTTSISLVEEIINDKLRTDANSHTETSATHNETSRKEQQQAQTTEQLLPPLTTQLQELTAPQQQQKSSAPPKSISKEQQSLVTEKKSGNADIEFSFGLITRRLETNNGCPKHIEKIMMSTAEKVSKKILKEGYGDSVYLNPDKLPQLISVDDDVEYIPTSNRPNTHRYLVRASMNLHFEDMRMVKKVRKKVLNGLRASVGKGNSLSGSVNKKKS